MWLSAQRKRWCMTAFLGLSIPSGWFGFVDFCHVGALSLFNGRCFDSNKGNVVFAFVGVVCSHIQIFALY